MKNNAVLKLCLVALIAAIYTTVSIALAPLTYGNIQVRVAEALTLLPLIFPWSIAGVTLGCVLTNLIGAMMGLNILGYIDVFVGTAATFCAAFLTYKLRNNKTFKLPLLAAFMPVLLNGLVIGAELAWIIFPENFITGWIICGLEVAIGEAVAVYVFGLPLIKSLEKTELTKKLS